MQFNLLVTIIYSCGFIKLNSIFLMYIGVNYDDAIMS